MRSMRETLNLCDSNYFSANQLDTKIGQLEKQKQRFKQTGFHVEIIAKFPHLGVGGGLYNTEESSFPLNEVPHYIIQSLMMALS